MEIQHNKEMSIYIIDMKIDNGCWISIPQVQKKVYTQQKKTRNRICKYILAL